MRFFWLGIFGGLGANARYLLDGWVSRRYRGDFPFGTFAVNVSGSFLLGFLFVLLTDRLSVSATARSAITAGLLGAYTTFSTLTFDTLRLIEEGEVAGGIANAAGSVAAGLVAVYLGTLAGRAF